MSFKQISHLVKVLQISMKSEMRVYFKLISVISGGNRDVLVSPGSYFFLSNSCGQGEEWLKSLNKGIWIPFTGTNALRHDPTI